jgi:hypothetical protein
VEVLVGAYKVAASVKAANVKDYAGEFKSDGDNHEVTYYIKHEGPFAVSIPEFRFSGIGGIGERRPFAPWQAKRHVPAYLK